jgi:hypothetical protein
MYPSSDTKHDVEVARGLGWASVAIGVAEILFPRAISRLIGIEDRPGLMRALGLRELVSALTILSEGRASPQLAAGLWSRVAGDAMDLTLLGVAAKKTTRPGGLTLATAMVLGITAVDVLYAMRLESDPHQQPSALGRAQSWGGRLRELIPGA